MTPVITLVISFSADNWDGAKSLHDMLNVSDPNILAFVPDYKINLISPAEINDAEFTKFRTGLGAVMQFIKHCSDKSLAWMADNMRTELMDRETVSLINAVTGADLHIKEKIL